MSRKTNQKKVIRKDYSKYTSKPYDTYDRMAIDPILKYDHGFTKNIISFVRGDVVVTKNVLNPDREYGYDDMLFKEYRPFLIIRSNPYTNTYTAVPITSHYPNKNLPRTHQRLVSIPPVMPDISANYADLSCLMTFRLEEIIGKLGYMDEDIVDAVEAAGIFYSCRYCEEPLKRISNIIQILEKISKDGNAIAKLSVLPAVKYREYINGLNDNILYNTDDEEDIDEIGEEKPDPIEEDEVVEENPEGEPFDPDAPENAMALKMWEQMQKHASMKKIEKMDKDIENLRNGDVKILEVKEESKTDNKRAYGRTPKISSIDIALKFYHDIYGKANTAAEAAKLLGISSSSEVIFRQTLNVILYKEFGTKYYIQYSRGKNSKRIPPEQANIDITKLKLLSSRIKLSDKK